MTSSSDVERTHHLSVAATAIKMSEDILPLAIQFLSHDYDDVSETCFGFVSNYVSGIRLRSLTPEQEKEVRAASASASTSSSSSSHPRASKEKDGEVGMNVAVVLSKEEEGVIDFLFQVLGKKMK